MAVLDDEQQPDGSAGLRGRVSCYQTVLMAVRAQQIPRFLGFAVSYLSFPEYMLAYSFLTSSKLLACPSSRLKDAIGELKARNTKRKVRPLLESLPPSGPGGPWVGPRTLQGQH